MVDLAQDRIRIMVFQKSKASFLSMLDEKGINYTPIPIRPGMIMNTGETFEIMKELVANSPLIAAMAWVAVEWIKARGSRKIIIETKDNRTVHLEGYDTEDVQKLLAQTTRLTAIDMNGEKPLQQPPKR